MRVRAGLSGQRTQPTQFASARNRSHRKQGGAATTHLSSNEKLDSLCFTEPSLQSKPEHSSAQTSISTNTDTSSRGVKS